MEPARPMASGVAFEDANGNQRPDPDEPGRAGVLVSNGLEVTQTDADGGYRLPVSNGDVLFVTKPSGYTQPLDGDRLSQFYYNKER